MDKNSVVYVGMDLGTYKTSVACSTGTRDVLLSAVGWPRDMVARAMLGRDVVFGKDLIEHRLALNVVRPFEKGMLKYNEHPGKEAVATVEKHKEAAQLLVRHAVSLTRPPKDLPIFGVIGAPSRATVPNKKVILDAARGTFTAAMIVSEPFSIAYGMNRLSDTLVIDIGAGTIDLCPIYGTFPSDEEQITVPLGGDFIDEHFYNRMREQFPQAQLSLNMARDIKERFGFVHNLNEKAIVTLPVQGKPQQFDVTEALRDSCRVIVPPILEALRQMIARFDPEFQERMLQNLILGGGGSQLRGLDRVIEEGMKEYGTTRVKKVGDAVYAGAVGALKLAMGIPPENWNKLREQQTESARVAAR